MALRETSLRLTAGIRPFNSVCATSCRVAVLYEHKLVTVCAVLVSWHTAQLRQSRSHAVRSTFIFNLCRMHAALCVHHSLTIMDSSESLTAMQHADASDAWYVEVRTHHRLGSQ